LERFLQGAGFQKEKERVLDNKNTPITPKQKSQIKTIISIT